MTAANGWNSVELRDNRYNQIVHMISAANGAVEFYTTEVSDSVAIVIVIDVDDVVVVVVVVNFAQSCHTVL